MDGAFVTESVTIFIDSKVSHPKINKRTVATALWIFIVFSGLENQVHFNFVVGLKIVEIYLFKRLRRGLTYFVLFYLSTSHFINKMFCLL